MRIDSPAASTRLASYFDAMRTQLPSCELMSPPQYETQPAYVSIMGKLPEASNRLPSTPTTSLTAVRISELPRNERG